MRLATNRLCVGGLGLECAVWKAGLENKRTTPGLGACENSKPIREGCVVVSGFLSVGWHHTMNIWNELGGGRRRALRQLPGRILTNYGRSMEMVVYRGSLFGWTVTVDLG